MSAPLPGALGVVRAYLGPDFYVASLPMAMKDALEWVEVLSTDVANVGDGSALVGFPRGDGLPCWFRARDVITIDVVSTEDPSL